MAKSFSNEEWADIQDYVRRRGTRHGLPRRSSKSVVIGSFNIRKLGKVASKSPGAWKMLAAFCSRFDLLAIQEVQADLAGLNHLRSLMRGYDLVASDTTGKFPGGKGMDERLAFLYRRSRVRRTEVASDITYDRKRVLDTLYEQWARGEPDAAFAAFKKKVDELAVLGKKPRKGPHIKFFQTFIRQPHCVSFEIGWRGTKKPYQLMVVNAHLNWGDYKSDRVNEFFALLKWMLERARYADHMYYPNMLLLGDLNLDFDNPARDRPPIEAALKVLNDAKGRRSGSASFNFPFIDPHPGMSGPFRTNARKSETFDQIALIHRDRRLPDYTKNATAGSARDGFDYGMIDYVEMFARAVTGKPFAALTKAEKRELIRKFEHDFSDHMPIWIRLPKP